MSKKLLYLISFSIFGIVNLQSQDVRYGIRAAANYSQISGFSFDKAYVEAPGTPDEVTEELAATPSKFENARLGVAVGFFADYSINEKFSIQPEIQFSNQGNSYRELQVNGIIVPVMVKYNISPVINVHLGPEVGFKVWEWEKNENFNAVLFSGVGGVGINISTNFYVDLRYSLGLGGLFKDGAEISIERTTEAPRVIDGVPTTIPITDRNTKIRNLKGKSSYFQLSFGYRI